MPLAVRTLPLAVALVAAALGMLAVLAPMLAIGAAAALMLVTLMMADLAVGLCLFAFSAAFFEAVPELGSISAAKVLGLVLLLSWLATLVVKPGWRDQLFSERSGLTLVLIALSLWALLSVLWAEDSGQTLSNVQRLVLNLLLIPIAYAGLQDMRQLRWFVIALLAGLLGSAAYGIVLAPGVVNESGRLEGVGLDPNYLALWLAAAGTLGAGVVARRRQDPLARVTLTIASGLCILALLDTASRTGLLAIAAVLICAPLLVGGGRRVWALAAVMLTLAGGAVWFVGFAPASAVEHVTENDGGSGRTDIWAIGLRMVEEHPVRGVGLGNFPVVSVHYLLEPGAIKRSDYIVDQPKAAHNTYLELLAETGLVGLLLFLAVFGSCLLSALRGARILAAKGLREEDVLARAVALAMIAVAVGAFFVSLEYTKPLWLLLALGPVVLGAARRAEPAATAARTTRA